MNLGSAPLRLSVLLVLGVGLASLAAARTAPSADEDLRLAPATPVASELHQVMEAAEATAAAERFHHPLLEGYEVVFADDFDGVTLGDAWTTCYWWQVDGGCRIHEEAQWYRPEAVTVADGVVELRAERSDQIATDGTALDYRSGMISTGQPRSRNSVPGLAFTYGFVEAWIRFPDGAGTWPAVWLLSADKTSAPEIDIVEWYGSRPDLVTSHVHIDVDGERRKVRVEHEVDDAAGGWHHVAVLWEADRIEFFFDGVSTGTVTDRELIPDTPMYLIINLALGSWAGEVDPAAMPQSVLVDRVRVWQAV